MGGFPVKQALPMDGIQMLDPFLLLHHARQRFDPLQKAIQQGVGPHPHRGFSPVTFVINGEIHHRDSRGNDQVAGMGEVQWMTAGMGLIHSERPTQRIVDEQIEQEIVQLWINTPQQNKMDVPGYRYLSVNDIPVVVSDDGLIQNKLVAGEWRENRQSNVRPDSDLLLLWARGQSQGMESYSTPNEYNAMIYLVKGRIRVNETVIGHSQLVLFGRAGSTVDVEILENAEFLFLAGRPINERIVQHGPFVMNHRTEILEAMRDYQMGKMGFLVES
jgi:redox-sensitive bicupin YhaK (pirin superfamily)